MSTVLVHSGGDTDTNMVRQNRGVAGTEASAKGTWMAPTGCGWGRGKGISPPQPTRGLGERRKLPSGVWARSSSR